MTALLSTGSHLVGVGACVSARLGGGRLMEDDRASSAPALHYPSIVVCLVLAASPVLAG